MLIICAVIQKIKYTESCLNTSLRKCFISQWVMLAIMKTYSLTL